ncbi:zinc finger protein 395b isoform X2 [Thalassophryne amazonica]|uniref:zinc finger protein 395b isoform X2 n=1 Tax=Thalassophryne amazonica TaxID=390379 RepID=UPI001471A0EC|nr:zinc finger protein 395b isoform X2 [Thalassophryne amazonica]
MAAMGPEGRVGPGPDGTVAEPDGTVAGPSRLQACISRTTHNSNRPHQSQILVCTQSRGQSDKTFVDSEHPNKTPVRLQQMDAKEGQSNLAAPPQTTAPTLHICNMSTTGEAPHSFRSPESVEMDEIMAAMVLTSLSCNPVVQSPPQTDPGSVGPSPPAEMECGGGELSDSGSSGYWSWDHGNMSPAPSPSVTEMDSSPDEGVQMEPDQGEELNAKKLKSSFRGVYQCLWPSCGKVLTSSVGMKKHVRMLHLGGSAHSQREEDFYYTKISCESTDARFAPAPSPQALGQALSSHLCWTSCFPPPCSELQIPPAHRPRSNSSSGPGTNRPSPLSQSAPSSFLQIHTEHLYQACSPVQVSVIPRNLGCYSGTPPTYVSGHTNTPMVKPRCRSVSVGEQWLQQNRLQAVSGSPSRSHCSFRKGRGETKKCRKVYGVERKDQWCTACRWKKACQRFPD